jgi:2-oxoglutarate/2-oxoacid ferredoxin oxidoreductase subunit beta
MKDNVNNINYDLKPGDFNTMIRPTWCTGCGNFAIWNAVKKAFVSLKLKPHEIIIVYGIGCSGNGTNYIKTNAFHALHGRALPVATGAKLANHRLQVIAMVGDGDGAGIGGNHFIHTCRRNIDITCIMHDNRVYGLTTGQTSPTSDEGFQTKSTPHGVLEEPINPLMLALAGGATFVARGFSGDVAQLTGIIEKAIRHRGFSFVDVLQPCVTFNRQNTYDSYRKLIYKLKEEKKYDEGDFHAAVEKARQTEKLPTGVLYEIEKDIYEDGLKQIERKPLVDHVIRDIDINKLLKRYA